MSRLRSKLILGTAALGMKYGVANRSGRPRASIVNEIVHNVWNRGVRFFDTAPAYGLSETVLGRALARLPASREACVITKLSGNDPQATGASILQSLERSLERLQLPSVWGVLLHDENQLDCWKDSLGKSLEIARRTKLVSRIGVSVYSPSRALQALEIDELDLIQLPANVFDRRMERAGVFELAEKRNKVVCVRSIFLQGLATMAHNMVPRSIPCALDGIGALKRFCADQRIDLRQFCVDYVVRMAPNARLVMGAETPAQALDNCDFIERRDVNGGIDKVWTQIWPEDIDDLIDPRRWNSVG